jgi:hypothetical protein
MATHSIADKSFLALAYEPPRKTDPRRKPFDPPGPWFDATVIALALVLGIGLLL